MGFTTLKFLLSIFLIILLLGSVTISNFSAYGHYDPPSDKAEKITITIKNIELYKNSKCPFCGKDDVSIDLKSILLSFSIVNEKHMVDPKMETGYISLMKKVSVKSLTKDYLPALEKRSNGYVYMTPSLVNNKVNQKIWTHNDCVEAEPITLNFVLLNPGNKLLQDVTHLFQSIIQAMDSGNEKIEYLNYVLKAVGTAPVELVQIPWIASKIVDGIDWLNSDEFLGIGSTTNVGLGTYKTEIVFPLTEDQQSLYDSRMKDFGEKAASEYLNSVLKRVGVVTWSYDAEVLSHDSGCKPKTFTISPANLTKSSSKDTTEKTIKKKAKPIPLKKSLKKTENEKTTNGLNVYPSSNPKLPVTSSNTKPQITLPKQISQEATGSSGAIVNYSVSAKDNEDGIIVPSCDHVSGTQFPFGSTTVTCTARDSSNNTVHGSFTVIVRDTTPPIIDPFQPIEGTRDDSGIVVFFDVTAHDVVDGVITPSCNYASGTKFPIGVTVLTCTADDSKGNHASRSLQITVTKKETVQ